MAADTIESLAKQGFRTIVIVPGHGDTLFLQMLELGAKMVQWLRQLPADVVVAVAPITSDGGLGERYPLDHLDCHAGFFETSVMMYLKPEWVRPQKPVDDPGFMRRLFAGETGIFVSEKLVDDPAVVPRIRQNEQMLIGVQGDPSKATAEWGQRIFQAMVSELVELIGRLEAGRRDSAPSRAT
jgi:creatinine amidohydrolase/Fe(II)-dependent formamide hydrolase-like protein